MASLAAKESETNAMEERLNGTKPLDDLKEQESELQRQNKEDQAIIQDENASPSDKEAAREKVEERNEELSRLQTQIAERERAQPLSERVKEILSVGNCYSSRRGGPNRGCRQFNNKRFESHRQSFGERPKR